MHELDSTLVASGTIVEGGDYGSVGMDTRSTLSVKDKRKW